MKQAKKFISILLATIMTLSVFAAMPMTVSAATATEGWGADPDDGIFYINNENDMLAFNVNAAANGNYKDKVVKLTADIDMQGIKWSAFQRFEGTLDGQGHSIKNLSYSQGSAVIGIFRYITDVTIKNISFINCTVNDTAKKGRVGIIAGGTPYQEAVSDVYFENVYVNGTITGGGTKQGGFVGGTQSSNTTYHFTNCVSDVTLTGKAASGFVGDVEIDTTVEMTDCVFLGNNMPELAVVSAFSGFTGADMRLERCISLGKPGAGSTPSYSYSGNFLYLDHENALKHGNEATIELIDCYTVYSQGNMIGVSVSASTTDTAYRGNGYDVTITYDGQKVYEHKDSEITTLSKENGTYAKCAEMNAAFRAIGTADGATLTAENFSKVCPALASSGKWAVTTETVEYAAGKNIVKILPASVAHMINAPIKEAPNATEYLQVRTTSAGYDIQFTGAVNVDDLNDYASVGFDVVVKIQDGATLMTETVKTQSVYTSIVADGADVSASTLGADYLNVLQIKGFKSGNVYEISILSFAEKADGTVVYDYNGALNVTVQNGALVD